MRRHNPNILTRARKIIEGGSGFRALLDVFTTHRQKGSTTALLAGAAWSQALPWRSEHPAADPRVVTANAQMKQHVRGMVERDWTMLPSSAIVTVEELCRSRGARYGALLIDNYTIATLGETVLGAAQVVVDELAYVTNQLVAADLQNESLKASNDMLKPGFAALMGEFERAADQVISLKEQLELAEGDAQVWQLSGHPEHGAQAVLLLDEPSFRGMVIGTWGNWPPWEVDCWRVHSETMSAGRAVREEEVVAWLPIVLPEELQ